MLKTFTGATREALSEIKKEMKIRKTNEVFLLFSLGSQFDHLIALKLGKIGVYCLVADPARVNKADVQILNPKGIILSGGPVSVYQEAPPFDYKIFDLGIPVLGICLGFQLWAQHIGLSVEKSDKREFGPHSLKININSLLFNGCHPLMTVLESHGDKVADDKRLNVVGETDNAPVAAAQWKHLWGVQFHPEVTETIYGEQIFKNFCFKICNAKNIYPAEKVAEQKIEKLREDIGDKKVLLALSGGSDSSVTAHLLKHALKGRDGQFYAIYIKAVDRPDDEAFVRKYFANKDWINFRVVDATAEFLAELKGKTEWHEKRLAVRKVYKAILEREIKRVGAEFIVQGTLYTDISESGFGYETGAKKARIKLHHNVNLNFSVPELLPLDDCVKDSGRSIGREIGTPEELLTRHPFPGPGLVIRIEGEITKEKLIVAKLADKIYIEELRKWKLYNEVWQAGVVVTSSRHTCTKGDDAFTGMVIAIFAVSSVNGFTSRMYRLPYDFLEMLDQRIGNEIREVGAVVYKISGKPYSTIEWG